MNKLPILLKREYWEHRGGFLWTPVWMTVSVLALTVLGMVSAEVFRHKANVNFGNVSLSTIRDNIDTRDFAEAGHALDAAQFMFAVLPCIALFFVLFFYLLGALYDDRRDRSVLFWKSLPVSDTATVASKVLAAMFIAPLIALAVSTLAYLVFVIVISAWLGLHGVNLMPALAASHPLRTLLRMALTIPVDALWALPAIGWLLFWSAWARAKPFLWAVMLPILAIFANWWLGVLGAPQLSGTANLARIVGRLLLSVMPGSWMNAGIGESGTFLGMAGNASVWAPQPGAAANGGLLSPDRLLAVLASANLWIGVVAGLALIAAAIWLRGRRIETAV